MLIAAAVLALTAPDPANWMHEIYASRPDTKLTQMVIPGTHDSGAFKIDTSGKCKVTPIAGVNPVLVTAAKNNPCAAGKLSKAQSQNFAGQLTGGIRYLDMRLGVPANKVVSVKQAKKPLSNKAAAKVPISLQHSYVSGRFTKGLKQIVGFAKAHPAEQIILDFQHIDLTGKKTLDKYYTSAIDKILRTYKVSGTSVCSRAWDKSAAPDILTTTLGQAWSADRNIIVLYAKGELPTSDCYRQREQVLYSPWPNTEDPGKSTSDNLTYLNNRQAALAGSADCAADGGNQCGLFVNQLQLSMGFMTQARCIAGTQTQGCSLEDLARLRNATVPSDMIDWQSQGLPINISIVDFYEINNTAPTLIALNLS